MVEASHRHTAHIEWTGNTGRGTAEYTAYSRNYTVRDGAKPEIPGSSIPKWRGDGDRYSPDDLLVAAVSACHMLWYLHLCADAGIVVTEYSDDAEGTLELDPAGGGRFSSVTLRPRVRLAAGDPDRARALHERAHEKCFVANSVNFPIHCRPVVEAEGVPTSAAAVPRAK
jgi:organic hydroperoxide reductase OsmC/OhrA